MTALLVIDVQKDFCRGKPHLDPVAANSARAVAAARDRGVEVVFVRFFGDQAYQGPSWRERDRLLGKPPKCLEGTPGAEFHIVEPAPGERVFDKHACFDAFLAEGFADHVAPFEHLVFAGLYADVCVDSTARTAFQKGHHITILADCTTSLHQSDAHTLRFMSTLYGARVTTLADGEETWKAPASRRPEWTTA